jgi:PAP2 superfamily
MPFFIESSQRIHRKARPRHGQAQNAASFHTILAVLAGVALWSIPYARWLTALWAGLIVVSTVTTGWHYIIDVVTGAAIASVCVCLAKVYTRLECKWLAWRQSQAIPIFEVPAAELNPIGCAEDYGIDASYVTSNVGRFCTSDDSR